MKRFLAFAGYIYYPGMGMDNFVGDFNTINEADLTARSLIMAEGDCPLMWLQVWDSETRIVVIEEQFK